MSGRARLLLLGDAGYGRFDLRGKRLDGPDPVLEVARLRAAGSSVPTGVLFLGDNVYGRRPRLPRNYGALQPGGDWEAIAGGTGGDLEAEQLLDQLSVARAGVPTWFLLGNHDWSRGVAGVRAQAALIGAFAAHHQLEVELLPEVERPLTGPADLAGAVSVRRLGQAIGVVAIDTEAGMRAPDACLGLRERLWDAVAALDTALVVVAGHHPVRSLGPHGRRRRSTVFTRQDIPARRYRSYIDRILHPPHGHRAKGIVVYASGHEHQLQILDPGPWTGFDQLLISGAGSLSQVGPGGGVRQDPDGWVADRAGLLELEVDGMQATCTMLAVAGAGATEVLATVPLST